MSVDESLVLWSTSSCEWTPRGLRFKVSLHPTGIGLRGILEARPDLEALLREFVGTDIDDFEVFAGGGSPGHLSFVSPGYALIKVPTETFRASVDETLRDAMARVAENVKFEKTVGEQWLLQLRGQG